MDGFTIALMAATVILAVVLVGVCRDANYWHKSSMEFQVAYHKALEREKALKESIKRLCE